MKNEDMTPFPCVGLSILNEPKTKCSACSVPILQRTADKFEGLCVPCANKAAAIVPDDFEVPPDIAERLISLNIDPVAYREDLWREGADLTYLYLDKLEEKKSLYLKWSPKLREFAKTCRKLHPFQMENAMSDSDQAKQKIYETKIRNRERLPPIPNRINIYSMPLFAIPVAQQLWPSEDDLSVILTPDELSQWKIFYRHPEDAYWWFAKYFWNIEDSPVDSSIWSDIDLSNLSEGEKPWLVTSGLIWGPTSGGAKHELWSWNGKESRFIGPSLHVQF